jgi:NTE family protein
MTETQTTLESHSEIPRIGLVLPGGGARAAYQVGVLRALADLLPARSPNPFPVIAGTSAGAINATELAIHAERFRIAAVNLERVWRNFEVSQVFRADVVSMLRGSAHWFLAMLSGGWLLPPPKSLFDNHPLRELLHANFDFEGINRSIQSGHLHALAIAAAGYSSSRSVSFFEGLPDKHSWYRVRRGGEATKITLDHLMASVAVPFLFPPVMMGNEYFGDGSMRQATPFSAAIHLGADRLLVIGTRNDARVERRKTPRSPSFGQIFGYMLDALFSDGLYSDLERLNQINDLLRQIGPVRTAHSVLKPVDLLVILPSRDLSEIARDHVGSLPRTLRVLLRTMGAMNTGGGELMSYLMFEGSFTRDLITLGYKDAMDRSGEIMRFMGGEILQSTGATQTMHKLLSNS